MPNSTPVIEHPFPNLNTILAHASKDSSDMATELSMWDILPNQQVTVNGETHTVTDACIAKLRKVFETIKEVDGAQVYTDGNGLPRFVFPVDLVDTTKHLEIDVGINLRVGSQARQTPSKAVTKTKRLRDSAGRFLPSPKTIMQPPINEPTTSEAEGLNTEATATAKDKLSQVPGLDNNQIDSLASLLSSVDFTLNLTTPDPTTDTAPASLAPFAHAPDAAHDEPSFGPSLTFPTSTVFMPSPPTDPTPFTNTYQQFVLPVHRWPSEPYNLLPFAGYLREVQPLTEVSDLPILLKCWDMTIHNLSEALAEVQTGIQECLRFPFHLEEEEEGWLRMTLLEMRGVAERGRGWMADKGDLVRAVDMMTEMQAAVVGFVDNETEKRVKVEVDKCVGWVDLRLREMKDVKFHLFDLATTLQEIKCTLQDRGADI